MQNLAGPVKITNADKIVFEELKRCGIPAVEVPSHNSEVQYSHVGRMGQFKFVRAWYYWMVGGRVPLAIAKKLYDHPVGKTDIRVCGHCGCPAPTDNFITWRDRTTDKILIKTDKWKEIQDLCNKSHSMAEYYTELSSRYLPKDDTENADGYVETYHIDSELGLYLFVQAIKDLPWAE